MKKLSTFVKMALAVQIGGVIYGITKESLDVIILSATFLVLSILELKGKIK